MAAALLAAPAAGGTPVPSPPAPLRIGVGGDYPNGLDGQLSARGYPWERIFPWEMNQPEVLRRYNVILYSCVPEKVSGIEPVLLDWVKAGGRAYVETWAAQSVFPLPSLAAVSSSAPQLGDVMLTDPASAVARGLDLATPFDMHHLQGSCLVPRRDVAGSVLARYCADKGSQPLQQAAAMVEFPVGAGRLIYSGAPVAFARFHRGRSSEGLLVGLIESLLPNGPAPRLLYTEPANTAPPGNGPRLELPESEQEEPEAGPPPPPEPPAPAQPTVGTLPAAFELIGAPAEEPYHLLARVAPQAAAGGGPTVLLLDGRFTAAGKPARAALWLALTPQRLEVRLGPESRGKPLASADWALPAEGTSLLLKRSARDLAVVLGPTEILRVPVRLSPGGGVAVRNGSVALAEPVCQPVAPAVFDDGFMRETDAPTPWTPVTGAWRNAGVGNESYSINGFYYYGRAEADPAVATAGDWFWQDYTLTAAVRVGKPGTQIGLCALVQEGGEALLFLADSAETPAPKLRLVRRVAGADSPLAEADGALAPGQWYRLGLRLTGGTIEATVDGQPVLACPNPEPRPGGIGLFVRGGAARFDDVAVRPSDVAPRSWGDEGSPHALLPPSLGPHDTLTWGSPATHWEADPERPSLLWHDGLYPRDFEVTLNVEPTAEPAVRRFILAPSYTAAESECLAVTVALSADGARLEAGAGPQKLAMGAGAASLRLARQAGTLTVFRNGKPVQRLARAASYRRLGLEVLGPPVRARDLAARSATAHDYVFGVAPTDWWTSSGEWQVSARWACDSRWSWLAGWGSGDAAIWNKRRFEGDVAVDTYMGVKMEAPGGDETQRCRDLNLVLCGDRQDPRSGYSFTLGGDGGVRTQLLRNGQVVAEAPDMRVPAGYNVHHCWFRVRMSRLGNVVACDFERRPVFRWEDPDPLPGGYVGLWTQNSGLLIPRVTIWGSEEALRAVPRAGGPRSQ